MPNTTTVTWPTLTAGQVARASDVEAKFDYSEHHLWPHSTGTRVDNTFDLGDSVTASWRHLWIKGGINPTITANGVPIGTSTALASARLDVYGTGAVYPPRLTTTDRNSLAATNGAMVYDTTLNQFYGYRNGSWRNMGGMIFGLQAIAHTNTGWSATGATNLVSFSGAGRIRALQIFAVTTGGTLSANIIIDSVTVGSFQTQSTLTTMAVYRISPLATAGAFPLSFTNTTVRQELATYFQSNFRIEGNFVGGGTVASITCILDWEHD